MNIFVLSTEPEKAATYLGDGHVPKMVLETAQILCTVADRYGIPAPYKPTHKNHPCVRWAGDSFGNLAWLRNYGKSLAFEYEKRFGRVHKSTDILSVFPLASFRVKIRPTGINVPFAQAMPDEFKGNDAVEAYRRYYAARKRDQARWEKGTPEPWWWKYYKEV